jgi:integrase
VPLNRLALGALEWHRARQGREKKRAGELYNDQDIVFSDGRGEPWNLTAISNAFARIARDAGIPAARLHDLRHSTASWLLQSGVDIRTVSSVLGHSTPTTTLGTYSHLMPGADADAVDAIARRLEAAVG